MARVHSLDSLHQRQPLPLGPIGKHLLSPTSVAHWPVEVSMGNTFGAAGAWFRSGLMCDSSQTTAGIFVAYARNTRVTYSEPNSTNICSQAVHPS